MRNGNFLKICVSETRVKRIRVNQGLCIISHFLVLIRLAHRHSNLVFQGGADRFGVEVEKWSLELAKNVCVTNP